MTGYAVTAQYYDPLVAETHAGADRQITGALSGLDTMRGPILDIGAGTGLTTALIATTLPHADILAIEPDSAMRPALMTRICRDPDLRRRVTILPFGILDAPLPDTIAGAVLSASLVHFAPEDRASLWTLLARRLASGGRIVIEVQCPTAENLPETDMGSTQVGRMVYRGTATAQRIGSNRQRWLMTYRSILEGREIRCDSTSYDCWTVTAEGILAEAAKAGLAGRIDGDLVVLARSR